MNEQEHAAAVDEGRVLALSRRLGEPAALREKRLEAFRRFRTTPPPDRALHLWRYTNPMRLLPVDGVQPAAGPAIPVRDPVPGGGARVVLGADGSVRAEVAPEARAAGLEIAPLATAGEASERLGSLVGPGFGLLEDLNFATWGAGVLIRIPAGGLVPGSVHVIDAAGRGLSAPRILVVAGEGSEATVVEDHRGGGEAARLTSVTELLLGPGAHLRHVVLQRFDPGTSAHLTTRGRVEGGASLRTVLASFGGSLVKMDLGAELAAPGAHSEIVGFVLGEDRQHMDHHTVHDHRAPRTTSNIDFKVALAGGARSAYTGLIRIAAGAPGSEAFQENRNLLLSEGSRAETIPELEIMTDDVQCSHGATVAPLDPEQVFYLESRGIPPLEAERLIVRGFVEGTLARMPDGLRDQVERLVEERIGRFLGGDR